MGGTGGVLGDVVLAVLAVAALRLLVVEGPRGLTRAVLAVLRQLPGVNAALDAVISREARGAVALLTKGGGSASGATGKPEQLPIPERGVDGDQLIRVLKNMRSDEMHSDDGKAFAYVYFSDHEFEKHMRAMTTAMNLFLEDTGAANEAHERLLRLVLEEFQHTNALNPVMFPSLLKFETEVVSMTAWMMNGDPEVVGAVTAGGTESILCAVKAYRELAHKKRPHVLRPNMVAPITVHPAFEKAAHYFGVEMIHVPVDAQYRCDVAAMKRAINGNTILLIGSAPQYAHGVIDPIEDIARLAQEKGLPCHVDACFGGFMLPWLEKLGRPIPRFDFRVPGVTSISADVHKYGYCPKGASVVLYRNAEIRQYQYFSYANWPGGLFASPGVLGSRPGGMLAAAWACMKSLGQVGYLETARAVIEMTDKLVEGINAIEGVRVATPPDMTCLAVVSSSPAVDILAVADAMERHGWKMERQQYPDSLHMTLMPAHVRTWQTLVADLAASVAEVRNNRLLAKEGTAGMYGLVANIPDRTIVSDFIVKFLSQVYQRKTTELAEK